MGVRPLKTTPKIQAQKDITDEIESTGYTKRGIDGDIWDVNWMRLYTKEQRQLNRQLGVHKLNKSQK